MTAVDAVEVGFPESAKQEGQEGGRAFYVSGYGQTIGIIYAIEPFNDDGSKGVHCSISCSNAGKPIKATDSALRFVQRFVEDNNLKWPERFDISPFEKGPFAGLGIHVWETP